MLNASTGAVSNEVERGSLLDRGVEVARQAAPGGSARGGAVSNLRAACRPETHPYRSSAMICLGKLAQEGTMENVVGIVSIVIALVAVVIAVWQGMLSKRQLDLAKETEGRTERALDEIQRLTTETKSMTEAIKKDVEERITRMLDSRLEDDRRKAESSEQASQAFLQMLLGGMNPGATPGGPAGFQPPTSPAE